MSAPRLPVEFLAGTQRAAFAIRLEATAAAREALDLDDKRRPRSVWMVKGGTGSGVVVPDKFVVGLASRRMPADVGVLLETVPS